MRAGIQLWTDRKWPDSETEKSHRNGSNFCVPSLKRTNGCDHEDRTRLSSLQDYRIYTMTASTGFLTIFREILSTMNFEEQPYLLSISSSGVSGAAIVTELRPWSHSRYYHVIFTERFTADRLRRFTSWPSIYAEMIVMTIMWRRSVSMK